MRVGIYDPYLDDVGGGEKYMMTLAQCLAEDHEVTVFWDNKADIDAVKERFSLKLDKVAVKKNIFSTHVSSFERLGESSSYDVIIFLSDGSIPFVLSKKLFLHIQQPLSAPHGFSFKDKVKLTRVTSVFFNSRFTADHTKRYLGKVKTEIIYPPVAIYAKETKKENIILHVGRFRIQEVMTGAKDFKKQTMMIEAFKQMIDKKMISHWEFVLAASVKKEDEASFEQLRKSAKGYPIQFLVNKTNDELWKIYSQAKIYWHASGFGEDLQKHPEFAEHFGISTVEAMGAGVVPIVINAGGQKEIVTDGKDGFLWDSLEELQQKTQKVATDKNLLERLAQHAKERAKYFSKESFCQNVKNLLT